MDGVKERAKYDFAVNSAVAAKTWHQAIVRDLANRYEAAIERGKKLSHDEVMAEAAKHVYDRKYSWNFITIGWSFMGNDATVKLPRNWRQQARRWLIENEA